MRVSTLLVLVPLGLLAGCAAGSDLCASDTECIDGRRCIDGRCRVVPDAGAPPRDAGPAEDAGARDAGAARDASPTVDAGPTTDAGPGPDGGEACTPGSCDDGNPCTADSCRATGCVYLPIDVACDDGDFCNGPDQCAEGVCSVHAGDPCEAPTTCDPAMAVCVGCTGATDCPDPTTTAWGACGDFATTCGEAGTQSRTVTTFACVAGSCRGTETIETQACDRDTDGDLCGSSSCDDWSGCGGFASECDRTGTRSRTCQDLACAAGTCGLAPERAESESCDRDTEGAPCEGGCGACGSGSCSVSDPLAGTGWQTLGVALDAGSGANADRADVAIHACEPVLAWTEDDLTYVARWDGSLWQPMGEPLDHVTTTTWATGARVAARAGEIVVLWAEWDGSDTKPYAARWDGTAWARLGTIESGQMLSFEMDVVIHPVTGHPWVAWNARPSTSDPTQVYVSRWDGSAWQAVGGALDANPAISASGLAPSLLVDDAGEVTVAWQESGAIHLRRWSGTSWVPVAGGSRSLANAFDAHLSGVPDGFVLGWRDTDGGETSVHVQRWNGTAWSTWASRLSATAGPNSLWMALGAGPSGETTIAWQEQDAGGTEQVWVQRFRGGLAPLGSGVLDAVGGETDALQPHVIVDPLDRPVVTWIEEATPSGTRSIHVRRHH